MCQMFAIVWQSDLIASSRPARQEVDQLPFTLRGRIEPFPPHAFGDARDRIENDGRWSTVRPLEYVDLPRIGASFPHDADLTRSSTIAGVS